MSQFPSLFTFLQELSQNNHREWFQEHKGRYEVAHKEMIQFAEDLLMEMAQYDHLIEMTGKKSLFRIYRDVRFSKNKAPYKTHWAGQMKRATEALRGGYYYHIAPNNQSFVAGGFWAPEKDDLKRIRVEIAADANPLREIITADPFVKLFGEVEGDELKTAPKGFSKEHPDIDLIRKKQFIVTRYFTDEVVHSADFLPEVVDTFRGMRPFFDYMSEVLTTDSNGVSVL
ncbi:MAG: DUF2461 domain-containing protein [Bacteroidota bacterium]